MDTSKVDTHSILDDYKEKNTVYVQKNSFSPLGFKLETSSSCSQINLFCSAHLLRTTSFSFVTSRTGWYVLPGSELAKKLLQEKVTTTTT